MLKKIVALSIVCLILVCLLVGGSWAYLQNSGTSNTNSLAAGTLDLKINRSDNVTATITAANFKAGNYIPRPLTAVPSASAVDIVLQDIGVINPVPKTMTILYNYALAGTTTQIQADTIAAALEVNYLYFNGVNILPAVSPATDKNSNTWIDIQDLNGTTITTTDNWNQNQPKHYLIQMLVHPLANTLQSKAINITFTFTLNQK